MVSGGWGCIGMPPSRLQPAQGSTSLVPMHNGPITVVQCPWLTSLAAPPGAEPLGAAGGDQKAEGFGLRPAAPPLPAWQQPQRCFSVRFFIIIPDP